MRWHDGRPFTSADVKCTFDLIQGTAKDKFRKNPRKLWYQNVKAVVPGGPLEVGWQATDPDRVTRVTLAFEPALGGRVELGTADGARSSAMVTLPCLGPTATAGNLVVTAHDEHGHPDQTTVREPFTLLGGACSAPLASFRVTPTPFTGTLGVQAPGAGRVQVLDASGRRVRELSTTGGPVQWDGHDEAGGVAPAGLYFVRFTGAAGSAIRRVVRLGR